jgi:hypothetical protein
MNTSPTTVRDGERKKKREPKCRFEIRDEYIPGLGIFRRYVPVTNERRVQ